MVDTSMLELRNETPFTAGLAIFPDALGIDTLFIVIKATFTLGPVASVAPSQAPLKPADEYHGEPGRSSLKAGSEMHPLKPATDVILMGQAQAPGRRPSTRLDVSLAVAGRRKTVRVFGDRQWTGGVVPPLMTPPAPFEAVPLVYERSFGGTQEIDPEKGTIVSEPRNPAGCGFVGKRSRREIKGLSLPNLEDPGRPLSEPGEQPPPAGFGFIAPSWQPRRSFAGTYDDRWRTTRAPLLPLDFDSRFLNAAHPDMVVPGYLKGGEPVTITNAWAGGPLSFALPGCGFRVTAVVSGEEIHPVLNLETVLIEPDLDRLCMLWRGGVPCRRGAGTARDVEVGLLDPGVTAGAAGRIG